MRRTGREHVIEEAIMNHPEKLGFAGALAIRNCRVSRPTGLADIVLLPNRRNRVRLVLVEAKVAKAPEAAAKVVGQLLMYYAGALMLGELGLEALRGFAKKHPRLARGTQRKPLPTLIRGLSPRPKSIEALFEKPCLTPAEIQLFIAIDGMPQPALHRTLQALRLHGLQIGLVVVQKKRIVWVSKPTRVSAPRKKLDTLPPIA
jgi:hypothetical protein